MPHILSALGNLEKVIPADSKLANRMIQLKEKFEDEDDLGTAMAKYFIK